MKIMKYLFLSIFIALTAQSCVEINDITAAGEKPIIEAYLAPGQPVSMKVFTEIPYSTTDSTFSEPIKGLQIFVKDNASGNEFLLADKGDGIYESIELIKPAGSSYSMRFEHQGRQISATTIIPERPSGANISKNELYRVERNFSGGFQPGQGGPGGFTQEDRTPIEITWANSDKTYYFVAAQYLENTLSPIVQFPANQNGFTRPPRRFNNRPVQTNVSNIQPQQFEYFGRYAIILYRLNPDYAALYENESTSTQNISTPASEITNGLGIFTGVNADTLLVTVKKQQ
jgi:hypothetical protein